MAETASAVAPLPADWRQRLRTRLLPAPDHTPEHCRFGGVRRNLPDQLLQQMRADMPATLKAAAVLLPITNHDEEPSLLLTVRAHHLSRHAGQICFPGGRLEASDADVVAAAVRETEEEIGVAAGFIDVVGFLPDHVVVTGYRVTPVVALLQPGFQLHSDSAEVADVFELPLAVALFSGSYTLRRRRLQQMDVDSWELAWGQHQIWGATAGMLMTFSEFMREQAHE